MIGKFLKIYILSWLLLFQQALASEVFFLENRGSAVTDFRNTRNRMNALGLAVTNTRPPNGVNRTRIRELAQSIRQTSLSLSRTPFSPTAQDIEKLNSARVEFNELETLTSSEHLQQIYSYANNHLRNDSILVPAQTETEAGPNQIPGYCENYPALDRELMRSFYNGPEFEIGSTCYELNGNGIELNLSHIGEALITLEDRGQQRQKRELQNSLINKAVEGILEESSAYAGIYAGTDDNLARLKSCSQGRAVSSMGNHELQNEVNNHEQNLSAKVTQLNQAFGNGANARKEALMASQVRQALVIGNLYNITSRARADRNGNQVATVGGNGMDQFSPAVYRRCQERMEAQYGFSMPDQTTSPTYNLQRCNELVEQERYQNLRDCHEALLLFTTNIQHQTAQRACYYQESGRGDEAPRNISADNLIPIMSASVDSNPLLFNRQDNRSLIPFVSSESNYVPSNFANQVKELPGAAVISRAVEDVLATNPQDPRLAIETRLAQPDMLTLMSEAIRSAQASESLNKSLKDEITSYQEQLGESAYNVCQSDGEHLHQFPSLVNEAIAEDLGEISNPEDRRRALARKQAAQCWMLQEDPPENEGGLPSGFFALGVGAIALGMIPGIGWAASAALIAAGTGVAATDSYMRFDHARDQLNATTAAFSGGWADTNLILSRAAARTDAHTNLWLEGLTVGILDVASPAARTAIRSLRSNDQIATSVNRFVNDESGALTLPSTGSNRSIVNQLEDSEDSLLLLTTRRIGDEDIPIRIGAKNLEHMREHDFPGGPSYIVDLMTRLQQRDISLDFLREIKSSNNGKPIFDDLLDRIDIDGENINLNELLTHIENHGIPSGNLFNQGINSILGEVDNFALRRNKPTSLFPADARLEDVLESLRKGEGEVTPVPGRDGGFVYSHDGRLYEGTFCATPGGCQCDSANVCTRSFGELNSLYPTCGPDIYQVSTTSNLVSALANGALNDPNYIGQGNFEAPSIIGAAKGNFAEGLIRQVSCQ